MAEKYFERNNLVLWNSLEIQSYYSPDMFRWCIFVYFALFCRLSYLRTGNVSYDSLRYVYGRNSFYISCWTYKGRTESGSVIGSQCSSFFLRYVFFFSVCFVHKNSNKLYPCENCESYPALVKPCTTYQILSTWLWYSFPWLILIHGNLLD